MRNIIGLALFSLMSLTTLSACREAEWVDLTGNSTDCIVVVFRKEATTKEINVLLNQLLLAPQDPTRRGRDFKSGIGAQIKIKIQEYVAHQVCFRPSDATDVASVRNWLKEEFEASPHVLGVFETSDPATIVLEEQSTGQEQSSADEKGISEESDH